jgi:hypothetical protein
MTMASNFGEKVQATVGPVLQELGFALSGNDDTPDEGGRRQHVVFYRSHDCKIQIYESSREGETNCMIAPLDAVDSFGLRTDKWQFLTRFSKRPDLPLAELADLASSEYNSYANPLEWVRNRIEVYYEAAHAGILEMYPTG